ncbi:MAG: hypothetical protein AAGC95_08430 [Pseudomonadota bacterium]
MIFVDALLLIALTIGAIAWWVRPLPGRTAILAAVAAITFTLGVYGALNDRWQASLSAAFGFFLFLPLIISVFQRKAAPKNPPYASGPAFTVLALVAGGLLHFFPITNLPEPSGPNTVGIRTFELTDDTRKGVLGVGENAPRRLLVRVWYPAEKPEDARPAYYFNDLEAKSTARGFGDVIGFGPLATFFKHAKTNAYPDAALVSDMKVLPTIFFSHGAIGHLAQNTVLMEELASHGYAVYSIQHTGDSAPTAFPNGDVIPSDPALKIEMETSNEVLGKYDDAKAKALGSDDLDERFAGQLDWMSRRQTDGEKMTYSEPIWVEDRLFVHNALQSGNAPNHVMDVVARSNFESTGQMGMSFGGAVTGPLCIIDERCAAGVNLDGAVFSPSTFAQEIKQPFMMFYSDHDIMYKLLLEKEYYTEDLSDNHWLYEFHYEGFKTAGLRQDIHRIEMSQVTHTGLTDYPLFMRPPLQGPVLGSAPTDVIMGAQNAFILGFFNTYLRGIESGFPDTQLKAYSDYIERRDASHIREWWLSKPEEERALVKEKIEEVKR